MASLEKQRQLPILYQATTKTNRYGRDALPLCTVETDNTGFQSAAAGKHKGLKLFFANKSRNSFIPL